MTAGREYLFVGADPSRSDTHPGGQMTASKGLVAFASANQLELHIVDTLQSSFPVPALSTRLRKALARLRDVWVLSGRHDLSGAIIFSSSGFSFVEKAILCGVSRMRGVPTILFVRSGHFQDELHQSWIRRVVYKLLLRIPTLLGAQGENWKRFYLALGVPVTRIQTVRNWLQPDVKNDLQRDRIDTGSATRNSTPRFLFVGWMVKKKGVPELIEAIEASSILRRCKFVFAGGGDLLDEIRGHADTQGLSNVELLGWQTPRQLRTLYANADIFVLPSHAEGFPNALMEALAAGLAVVACDVGAISDSAISGRNAILIPPAESKTLREALEKLATNVDLLAQFKQESYLIAEENHDYEKNLSALFSSFDNGKTGRPGPQEH